MITMEAMAVFVLASAALSLSPGPDNIFVLTQSAMQGRRAGMLVTLGLCTGLFVHTGMVTFGLAAIFQTSEFAFNALKIIGGLYLLYLAWHAVRSNAAEINTVNDAPTHWKALYLRGIIMNITNPKVAIFFLAFLPQFTDPVLGSMPLQLIILGGLFIMTSLLVFSSIAWTAGHLGDWLKASPTAQTVINRIAAMVFVGLALKLVVSGR